MVAEAIYNNRNVVELNNLKKKYDSESKSSKKSSFASPANFFSEPYYKLLKDAIIANCNVNVDENGE